MEKCILVMAGGTGGHVFPALAVARELRERGWRVVWIGTRLGMESKLVPQAGFEMEWIAVGGLRGKGTRTLLAAPFNLVRAVGQAVAIVRRLQPAAVLGMGGFAAGPGGLASWILRRPLVIHEQNAIAGMTNVWLARFAQRVCSAFPKTFNARTSVTVTGNPVRREIVALAPPAQRFEGRQGPLRLLVVGGSLGAQALNEIVPAALAGWDAPLQPQVWHQTGAKHLDVAQSNYRAAGVSARVVAFIDEMAEAYGWADLVLCRAGALTVSELAAAGVASLLVPYPHAVDDHQTANAGFLVDCCAARLIQQSELTVERLRQSLFEIAGVDAGRSVSVDRSRLLAMARAARAVAQPDATGMVANICEEVARRA